MLLSKYTNVTIKKQTIAPTSHRFFYHDFSLGSTVGLFHVKQVFSFVSRETQKNNGGRKECKKTK